MDDGWLYNFNPHYVINDTDRYLALAQDVTRHIHSLTLGHNLYNDNL